MAFAIRTVATLRLFQLGVFQQEHGDVRDAEIGERNESMIPLGDLDWVAIGEVLLDPDGEGRFATRQFLADRVDPPEAKLPRGGLRPSPI